MSTERQPITDQEWHKKQPLGTRTRAVPERYRGKQQPVEKGSKKTGERGSVGRGSRHKPQE